MHAKIAETKYSFQSFTHHDHTSSHGRDGQPLFGSIDPLSWSLEEIL